MVGDIHSIETFGTVDGPGVRFVLFLQGCPMRCAFCHNPDTWEIGKGTQKNANEIASEVLKYERYLTNGGVTVSGGEPLLQIDFLIELFTILKEKHFHTCIDTSGCVFDPKNREQIKKLKKLFTLTDLVLLDIKHIDDKKHIELTGKSNKNILEFAKFLSEQKVKVWLRYVLLPTINSDEATLKKWKKFASTLKNVEKIEILPYHKLGIEKYKKLHIPYRLENLEIPTEEDVALAKKILNA